MNNNNLSTITSQQTITSIEIAQVTGRMHKNVMQAIRNMEPAWYKINGLKFQLVKYQDAKGQSRPMYQLTKTECLFVATKFNDEARAKLVLRWEQLEKERLQALQTSPESAPGVSTPADSTLPADPRNMTRLQILQLALEAEEENQQLKDDIRGLEADNYGLMLESSQQKQEIERLQERTRYLDVIDRQRDTVTISQIAQDYGQSAVAFNQLLKGLRIQRKIGEQWILYSDFIDRGYVANRMVPIHHAGGPDTYKPMTVWTQPGRRFLYEKLKKHGVLPLVERQQATH